MISRIRFTLKWLAAIFVFIFAPAALAQSTSSSISLDDFYSMIQAMKGAARSMSPYLIDEGAGLLGIFFGIGAFLLMIQFFFGPPKPHVMASIIFHIAKGVLVAAMLASWVNYGTGPNQETVSPAGTASATLSKYKLPVSVEDIVITPFDGIASGVFSKFSGGAGKEKVVTTLGSIWDMMWKASAQRDQMREDAMKAASAKADGFWDKLSNAAGQITAYLALLIEKIGDKIVTFVAIIVISIFAVMMMLEYLYVIYWGDLMAFLGMFVGPILVPCLLWERFERFFDAWVKWMIEAGFYKLIAAWVAVLTLKTVEQIQVVANNMYQKTMTAPATVADGAANVTFAFAFIISIVMTVFYMYFGIRMMRQVPDLAGKVTSGQAGGGAKGAMKAGDQAYKDTLPM
jgi:hypothetical protein